MSVGVGVEGGVEGGVGSRAERSEASHFILYFEKTYILYTIFFYIEKIYKIYTTH